MFSICYSYFSIPQAWALCLIYLHKPEGHRSKGTSRGQQQSKIAYEILRDFGRSEFFGILSRFLSPVMLDEAPFMQISHASQCF